MTQLVFRLDARPSVAREDFLVAPANAAAVAWIDRWPGWPARLLTVHGPAGCGKSHLAAVWRARTGAAALDDPTALTPAAVPTLLPPGAALVIDRADAVAGAPAREQALFHLINLARETDGWLLLAAGDAPARWPIALADLRSRLVAAPAVAVEPPDEALLAAVMTKQFADRQLTPSARVIPYLLSRMDRSFAAARRLVEALDHAALTEHRPITVPLAREVLAGLGPAPPTT